MNERDVIDELREVLGGEIDRLINLFLEDVYGARRILADKVIPTDIVLGTPVANRHHVEIERIVLNLAIAHIRRGTLTFATKVANAKGSYDEANVPYIDYGATVQFRSKGPSRAAAYGAVAGCPAAGRALAPDSMRPSDWEIFLSSFRSRSRVRSSSACSSSIVARSGTS